MKKTVLALAAIAASSAAFAQSSVTLYGVVDASVESVKGNAAGKSTTFNRVSSDNLATSRIGFKGVEDLGGGLKAKFQLESAIKADTGANGNSRFFDRAAWVGVSSADAGELRIGRQDSLIGAQMADTIGTQPYDASVIAGTLGGNSANYRRIDNALTYIAPTVLPGLTVAAQYSTAVDATNANNAEAKAGSNLGRGYGLSANYVMGPASAGVSYIRVKGAPANNTVINSAQANAGLYLYGAYDLGVAKLTAYYNDDSATNNTAVSGHRLYGFLAAVPVITNLTVTGGYAYARNEPVVSVTSATATTYAYNAKSVKHDNAGIITLKAQYDLSKRTAVYALFSEIQNGNNAGLSLSGVTTIADKSARGVAVGVRHAF